MTNTTPIPYPPLAPEDRPPCPHEGWKWSERLEIWIHPEASPVTGTIPPEHRRYDRPGGNKPRWASPVTREVAKSIEQYAVEIAKAWLEKCKDGDIQSIKELLDRIEGKVVQPVEAKVSNYTVLTEKGHHWPGGEPDHEGEPT